MRVVVLMVVCAQLLECAHVCQGSLVQAVEKTSTSVITEVVMTVLILGDAASTLLAAISADVTMVTSTLEELVQASYQIVSQCFSVSIVLCSSLDVNECALGLDNCVPEAKCENYYGSFNCICPGGRICNGYCHKDNQTLVNHESRLFGQDKCDNCTCTVSGLPLSLCVCHFHCEFLS